MELAIIAAIADNGAIGKDNNLLWHISEDLKYFKRTTSGFPVIMGRKTYESIGRPLPKRRNIVISRTMETAPGLELASSLDEALKMVGQEEKCFIIGGGSIYSQALDRADTLYITHVHTQISKADTFFPEINPLEWSLVSHSETFTDVETSLTFNFAVYKRV